jgi:hypothetical protein
MARKMLSDRLELLALMLPILYSRAPTRILFYAAD